MDRKDGIRASLPLLKQKMFVLRAALFGSFARTGQTEASDVDVLGMSGPKPAFPPWRRCACPWSTFLAGTWTWCRGAASNPACCATSCQSNIFFMKRDCLIFLEKSA